MGLAFTNLMAVISPCVWMLDLMRVYTTHCLLSPGACLWIGRRLVPAATWMWGILLSLHLGRNINIAYGRKLMAELLDCTKLTLNHIYYGSAQSAESNDKCARPAVRD